MQIADRSLLCSVFLFLPQPTVSEQDENDNGSLNERCLVLIQAKKRVITLFLHWRICVIIVYLLFLMPAS